MKSRARSAATKAGAAASPPGEEAAPRGRAKKVEAKAEEDDEEAMYAEMEREQEENDEESPSKKRKLNPESGEPEDDDDASSAAASSDTRNVAKEGGSHYEPQAKWTPEEDAKLLALVQELGDDNWMAVEARMGGTRNAKVCRTRFKLKLDPSINKGPWTPEEDARVIALHQELGRAWTLIAKQMPGRTEISVKSRIMSRQRSQDREWTPEDDATLRSLFAQRKSFEEIRKTAFPRRSVHSIKKRWERLAMNDMTLKMRERLNPSNTAAAVIAGTATVPTGLAMNSKVATPFMATSLARSAVVPGMGAAASFQPAQRTSPLPSGGLSYVQAPQATKSPVTTPVAPPTSSSAKPRSRLQHYSTSMMVLMDMLGDPTGTPTSAPAGATAAQASAQPSGALGGSPAPMVPMFPGALPINAGQHIASPPTVDGGDAPISGSAVAWPTARHTSTSSIGSTLPASFIASPRTTTLVASASEGLLSWQSLAHSSSNGGNGSMDSSNVDGSVLGGVRLQKASSSGYGFGVMPASPWTSSSSHVLPARSNSQSLLSSWLSVGGPDPAVVAAAAAASTSSPASSSSAPAEGIDNNPANQMLLRMGLAEFARQRTQAAAAAAQKLEQKSPPSSR